MLLLLVLELQVEESSLHPEVGGNGHQEASQRVNQILAITAREPYPSHHSA